MTKILTLSDDGVASGFGRIAMHLNTALARRGYSIMAASIQYDGLLPPQYEGQPLPYWVASLAGKNWLEETARLIGVYQPDIVLVIQDAPYAHHLRHALVDWSQHGFIAITPVDGLPILPDWIDTIKKADAALTISEFGVKAFREAGVNVGLCRPGIDPDVFYRLPDAERLALRQKLNIAPDAFVMGMMAQNQGRKDIPDTLRAFFEFAKDKPAARLLLDMDAVSPAGWNIPAMCQQFGWDANKLIFRIDAQRAGLLHLRERYNLLDVHSVLSHREGFGLPLLESMACGVATMALDWCSGAEIVGKPKKRRGLLIRPLEYTSVSTWGNALDKFPDIAHVVSELQRMVDHPHERALIAERGMTWARAQSWTAAVDHVVSAIERVGCIREKLTKTA
jgi:glycosyltransferase involved in cell wall biosynthesis